MVILSDMSAILGETRTNNCLHLLSEVTYITDRFQSNFTACIVCALLSNPTAIDIEIRTKDFSAAKYIALHYCSNRLQRNLHSL
jgi:hypothetical protein